MTHRLIAEWRELNVLAVRAEQVLARAHVAYAKNEMVPPDPALTSLAHDLRSLASRRYAEMLKAADAEQKQG